MRRAVALALIFSIVLPTAYAPRTAPRAEALFGVGDINIESIPQILEYLFQQIGRAMAQRMIDDMVQSTVKWANSGFDGNPAFPKDWGRDLENIAKGEIGKYIMDETKFGFLCSPFQAQIQLSILAEHNPQENRYRCTLDDIGVNYEEFVDNFEEGGWDAWFEVTQKDQNNPFGAHIAINNEIRRDVETRIGLANQEREFGNGFLSYRECEVKNVAPNTIGLSYDEFMDHYESLSPKEKEVVRKANPGWDPSVDGNGCIKEGPVKTPGSVIGPQLNKALGVGIDGLVQADDINSLVSAFANGLLQRYVFGSGKSGLISDSSSAAAREEVVDTDGDRIPDGLDTDGDGDLDICHHGRKNTREAPSDKNCIPSKGVSNSPYFLPICNEISTTIRSLENFKDFLARNPYDRAYANTWMNRIINANETADSLMNTLLRYEIQEFDPAVNVIGQFTAELSQRVVSFNKYGTLATDDGDDISEMWRKIKLIPITDNLLAYLQSFDSLIGDCENPNTGAIGEIEAPIGGAGALLSCAPSNSVVQTGESVTWSALSSYPDGTTYAWSGDLPSGTELDDIGPITVTYSSVGTKSVGIRANPDDGDSVSADCSPLEVTDDKGF